MTDHLQTPSASRWTIVAPATGAIAASFGVVALAGWQVDLPLLRSLVPGGVSMNPTSAACFVLCGFSLWSRTVRSDRRAWRIGGIVAAAIVLLVAFLKLSAVAGSADFAVDQWLFRDRLDGVVPNRIAPNTAINLFLIAVALLALDAETRRGRRPAQIIVLAPALLSCMAVLGYAYGVTAFYGVTSYIPMAFNTALAFGILCAGIFLAHPDRGLARVLTGAGAGSEMARRMLPAVGLIGVLGWLRMVGERAGLYTPEFGLSLTVLSSMVLLTGVIWATAAPLERVEAERQQIQQALQHAIGELEARLERSAAELRAVRSSPEPGPVEVETRRVEAA